jgi:hypothetical protein
LFFLGCLFRVLDDTLAISDPQAMLLVLILFPGLVKAEADWTDTLAVIPGLVLAWLVICAVAFRRVPSLTRDHPGAGSLRCPVLRCRCRLRPSPYLAGVIRRYRRQIGSCWRNCNPGQQALLVLAHLRQGEDVRRSGGRVGIGTATAWRYVRETVALLAARRRSCPRRWRQPRRPATRSWSSTVRSSRSTAWRLTGRSTRVSTAATA